MAYENRATVILPPELLADVAAKADAEHRSLSQYLRLLIQDGITYRSHPIVATPQASEPDAEPVEVDEETPVISSGDRPTMTNRLTVVFTDQQFNFLKRARQATGMTVSQYVRRLVTLDMRAKQAKAANKAKGD